MAVVVLQLDIAQVQRDRQLPSIRMRNDVPIQAAPTIIPLMGFLNFWQRCKRGPNAPRTRPERSGNVMSLAARARDTEIGTRRSQLAPMAMRSEEMLENSNALVPPGRGRTCCLRPPKPVVVGSSPTAPASFRLPVLRLLECRPSMVIATRRRRDVMPPYLDLLPLSQYIAATCCRPVLADIRRGFEFPRTIEPAWRSSLKKRAGR
jgi:hypothetical protein